MTGLDLLTHSLLAGELKKKQKRVILLWLAGGASQLETFDPKPGAPTGGPFRSIQTAMPGVHISELMPKMAARMKNTLHHPLAEHAQRRPRQRRQADDAWPQGRGERQVSPTSER